MVKHSIVTGLQLLLGNSMKPVNCARRAFQLLLCVSFMLAPAINGWPQSASPTEYEIKAAFIYKFTGYVRWPDSVFASEPDHFKIGILGQDPFKTTLEDILAGKKHGSRGFVFERSTDINDLLDCQVVFIARSEENNLASHLKTLSNHSILTISDMDNFAEQGGIIDLIQQGNKIQFEINIESAKTAKLRISSKLLRLAKIIYPKSKNQDMQ